MTALVFSAHTQAQTKDDFTQPHPSQSAIFFQQPQLQYQLQYQYQIEESSPTLSCSSVSSSSSSSSSSPPPSLSASPPPSVEQFETSPQQQPINAMYTFMNQQNQAAALFPMMSTQQLLQYSMSAPAAEDCLASSEYAYSAPQHQQQQQQQPLVTIKSDFPSEQLAAINSTYMMSMARSFSDSRLSGFYSAALPSGTASSVVYTYGEGNVCAAQQQQQQQAYPSRHQNHHYHNYSVGSFPNPSEDSSSVSPPPSLSFHPPSSSASTHPLSRTLSEPTMAPLYEQSDLSSTRAPITDLIKVENESHSSSPPLSPPMSVVIRPTPKRSRGRRVSSLPDSTLGCKVFTCPFTDCGKIFKRSEHLKRHVRSIHTMEKPFPCPIQNCSKRFSRSDNLNQHVRIHRHNNGIRGSAGGTTTTAAATTSAAGGSGSMSGKNSNTIGKNNCGDDTSKAMATTFSPFLQSFAADLVSLS